MITWIGKHNSRRTEYPDVRITTKFYSNGRGAKRPKTTIRFRQNIVDKIGIRYYVMIGVEGSCLYFKDGNVTGGYKLNRKSSNASSITISDDYSIYDGSYELQYDEGFELYFIDADKNLDANEREGTNS